MKLKISLLFLLWSFSALSATGVDRETLRAEFSQRPGWWIGTGSCVCLQITPEEAANKALERARQNAIERACGVQINAYDLVSLGVTKGDITEMRFYGYVVRDTTLFDTLITRTFTKIKAPEYYCEQACSIRVVNGPTSATFRLQAALDKGTYRHGESGRLEVQATEDCYLTVFGLWADGSVALLFPSDLLPEVHLKAAEKFTFPDTLKWPGLELQFFTLPGDPENSEHYKVVATKTRRPFLGGFGPAALEEVELAPNCKIRVIKDRQAALQEFCSWFFSIPPEEVAVEVVGYRVVRK